MSRINIYNVFLLCLTLLIFSCDQVDDSHQKSIVQWQQDRLAELVKEDGWVTLTGLYPLKEGSQRFGSGSGNAILFPDFAPDSMGLFIVTGDHVLMQIHEGVEVLADGKNVSEVQLIPSEKPVVCSRDQLQWFVIKRGNRFLVRVRDKQHPARKSLTHIPYYPIDKRWLFEATYHAYDSLRNLPLPNALDMLVDNESPGYLTFDYQGAQHSLIALDEGSDQLFILLFDETSGSETYGGGRYMYVDKPGNDGQTALDFNKAYSPPCAFTTFATCLLPPQENRLPFAIMAGEKDPHFLEH